jgi:Zn finger protein HypA/HybF involved in hydrogenase expression
MIKKCKQCGRQLRPDESNNLCEKCRQRKRDMQAEEKIKRRERDKTKTKSKNNQCENK